MTLRIQLTRIPLVFDDRTRRYREENQNCEDHGGQKKLMTREKGQDS